MNVRERRNQDLAVSFSFLALKIVHSTSGSHRSFEGVLKNIDDKQLYLEFTMDEVSVIQCRYSSVMISQEQEKNWSG